jgi:hypothetical protein
MFYLYIKYVAQIERKKKLMNRLCLKFAIQTRLLNRLIGQARLKIKPLTGKRPRLRP